MNTLICGVNWLGDSVMVMPALQAYRAAHPGDRITMLVKRPLTALWRMHAAVDDVWGFGTSAGETLRTVRRIRPAGFERAFVLPNSFRSALLPCLGGVPDRRGLPGQLRSLLLTRHVRMPPDWTGRHQCWEYAAIFGLDPRTAAMGDPCITPPDGLRPGPWEPGDGHWAALLPGAARGPSKRWPAARFGDVGRRLGHAGYRIVVLGAAGDAAACGEAAREAGPESVDLAGQTSLAELAAVLRRCRLAVANDSGGMHLATAVGTPVVAVFGATDPRRTGPLGTGHACVAAPGVRRGRDIARRSASAAAGLGRVTPEQVWDAVPAPLKDPDG